MTIVLWAVLALGAGFIALAFAARLSLRHRPPLELPPGETLPPTVLQTLARRTLLAGLALVVVAGFLVVWWGPSTFYEHDGFRLTVTLLLLAALVVLAGFTIRVGTWARRPGGPLDERDREIFRRSPALESGPMLVTLAFWVVGLQQAYWDAGAVPLVYLYLIFWSLIMVKSLALPIGVLIGYRRS